MLTDHLIHFYPFAIREAERTRETLSDEFITSHGLPAFLKFVADSRKSLLHFKQILCASKRIKFQKLLRPPPSHPTRDWWSCAEDYAFECVEQSQHPDTDGLDSNLENIESTYMPHVTFSDTIVSSAELDCNTVPLSHELLVV
jgi:hypothetical protein